MSDKELKIDREINVKDEFCPYPYLRSKLALEEMEIGETLRILVNTASSIRDVPRSFEEAGQKIVQTKQLNDTDWEILVQKQV